MKKILVFSLVAVMLSGLVGCTSPSDKESDVNTDMPKPIESNENKDAPIEKDQDIQNNNTHAGITVNEINFERVKLNDLPKEVQETINEVKMEKNSPGHKLIPANSEGYYYLAVFGGKKPNAGYDIKIERIQDNEGMTIVSVREITPKEDTMAAQVVTYPVDIVKVTGITDDINIVVEVPEIKDDIDLLDIEIGQDQKTHNTQEELTDNEISFERVKLSTLPKETQAIITEEKMGKNTAGHRLIKDKTGEHYYLVVFGGRRPNAGYDVKIERIQNNEGMTIVSIREIEPKEDTMAAQVITYPIDIVKVKGITEDINISILP